MKIVSVHGREIFDSRGMPTTACDLILEDGMKISSSVPSGASCGQYEAVELRDGGDRLMGKGVRVAVENIEKVIAPSLVGKEVVALELDRVIIELDGTSNKQYLGANATLAVSMALFKAQAYCEKIEVFELLAYMMGSETVRLPYPLFNMINGGAHADNNLRIQEFMIIPVEAKNFLQAMEVAVSVFYELKKILRKQGKTVAVGDEGGFAPRFSDEIEALDCLMEAVNKVYAVQKVTCAVALDVAASQFYEPSRGLYNWHGKYLSAEDLLEFYVQLAQNYPLYAIEDGLDENDWEGWQLMTKLLGERVLIVGDDIFATNVERLSRAIQNKCATATIIKPNQIGTISEALQAMALCNEHDFEVVVSHRSGETCDTFIADLAVGGNARYIKSGGCSRSERMAKYNRLLEIEQSLMINEKILSKK